MLDWLIRDGPPQNIATLSRGLAHQQKHHRRLLPATCILREVKDKLREQLLLATCSILHLEQLELPTSLWQQSLCSLCHQPRKRVTTKLLHHRSSTNLRGRKLELRWCGRKLLWCQDILSSKKIARNLCIGECRFSMLDTAGHFDDCPKVLSKGRLPLCTELQRACHRAPQHDQHQLDKSYTRVQNCHILLQSQQPAGLESDLQSIAFHFQA